MWGGSKLQAASTRRPNSNVGKIDTADIVQHLREQNLAAKARDQVRKLQQLAIPVTNSSVEVGH